MKRLIITGNVGQDPELRLDNSGTQFTTFSVAVAVGTKQNPKTDWVDISCNGKLAEIAYTYAKKGTKVLIDGYPTVNAYINKDNIPIGTLKLYANSLELLKFPNGDKIEEHSVAGALELNTHDIPF
ncbi:MAG: single-stranded DNA-binding protein [Burkholderiales bacterium]|nr:single-stranded DNA-binding protein [Burkholderiales bacterium]